MPDASSLPLTKTAAPGSGEIEHVPFALCTRAWRGRMAFELSTMQCVGAARAAGAGLALPRKEKRPPGGRGVGVSISGARSASGAISRPMSVNPFFR